MAFQTAELLEMILRLVDSKTLLTSVTRVNRAFNDAIATSPRLQRDLFRSFNAAPSIQVCQGDLLINDFLQTTTFRLSGKTSTLQISPWCVTSEENCRKELHGVKIKLMMDMATLRLPGRKSRGTVSWRKLRLAQPLRNVADYPATITIIRKTIAGKPSIGRLTHGVKHKTLATDLTLGELLDWAVSNRNRKRLFWHRRRLCKLLDRRCTRTTAMFLAWKGSQRSVIRLCL